MIGGDMADPCKQEGVIGGLEATMESVAESLKDLKHGQERFITVLETIAAQGTKITKLESDTDGLYSRVRQVELEGAKADVKITGAAAFVSIVISAVVAYIVKVLE
jgi:hypothetical protein